MKRKNVLVLILDGTRADRLGCYGHHRNTSPALDRFAAKSMLCLNHYTVGHSSTQSHVSLFTGVHPQFHGAPDNLSYYDGRLPTLTQLLRKNGYYVYGVSTDINLYKPERGMNRGYHRYVYLSKSKAQTSQSGLVSKLTKKMTGKAMGLRDIRLALARRFGADMNKYYENFYLNNDSSGQLLVNTFARDLERFPADRPFFAFANILETHSPYLAPKAFREAFGPVTISDKVRDALFSYSDRLWSPEPLSDEEKEAIGLLYDCEVRYLDFLVGQLLQTLERQGRLDDTLVIFTADHGGMLGEQENRVGPVRNTYQGIMKTPLIVYSPGQAGRQETRLTSIVDVFGTVLAETGTPNETKFNYQCRNVLSKDWEREFVVCEVPVLPAPSATLKSVKQIEEVLSQSHVNRTMVFRDAKFIWRSNGKHLFFDLARDPGETVNLFPNMSARQYQDLVRKLLAWYESQRDSDKPFCLETFGYSFWNVFRDRAAPPNVAIQPDQVPDEEETIADKLDTIVSKPL